ncbi:MAG TPA: DUF3516 domain-containing protein [Jiangellales bacterium]|nr:DUF3516 domain-containing protein [Jiangellales bacterium]
MRQTVPEEARTEELADIIEWLGELVRQVDSSLLDEWARLRSGSDTESTVESSAPPSLTRNERALRVLVRNAMFRRVTLAALHRYDELGELDADAGWSAADWEAALSPYYESHDEIATGPAARGPALFMVDTGRRDVWRVRQIIDDPAGDHDWAITAEVDLAASDEAGEPVIHLLDVSSSPPTVARESF